MPRVLQLWRHRLRLRRVHRPQGGRRMTGFVNFVIATSLAHLCMYGLASVIVRYTVGW